MWEFLVDRDGVPTNAAVIPFKTADQQDFRAPSNVNRWLKDGRTQGLELLEACLTDRWKRRSGAVFDVYMAKKLGQDWALLGHDEKELFTQFVLSSKAVFYR
jgi:hypothetical protein